MPRLSTTRLPRAVHSWCRPVLLYWLDGEHTLNPPDEDEMVCDRIAIYGNLGDYEAIAVAIGGEEDGTDTRIYSLARSPSVQYALEAGLASEWWEDAPALHDQPQPFRFHVPLW